MISCFQTLLSTASCATTTRHQPGDTLGPFRSRHDPHNFPQKELVVLLKGELLCAGEPPLEAPCVVVPGIAYALSGHQAEKFGQLVGRCRLTPL